MRGSGVTDRTMIGVAAALLCGLMAPLALSAAGVEAPESIEEALRKPRVAADEPQATYRPDERATFIIRLHEPPAAQYRGGIPGLEATNAGSAGAARFQSDRPAVRAYRDYLRQRQREVLAGIERRFGLDLNPERRFQLALNGFAVEIDRATARRIERMAEVASVEEEVPHIPLTFAGPDYINAPSIWNGTIPDGVSSRGEGTVIAIVDSGVRPTHEAFAETASDGYVHTNPLGDGNFIGVCDPGHPDYDDRYACNNKLIGAFHFNGEDAFDDNGHGTHVAGTAAGNPVTTPDGVALSGVAPRANLINYRICAPGCTGMPDVAEDILDRSADLQVDVVNYSIGPQNGGGDPYSEASSQAFLSLHEAGVAVFAAGGNAGPTTSSISNFAPWNVTVGSSDHGGRLSQNVTVTGPGSPGSDLQDIFALPSEDFSLASDLTGDLVLTKAIDTELEQACDALPENSLDGVIGVAEAGGCEFATKSKNMADAGAVGAIFYSGQDYGAHFVMGGTFSVPTVWIDYADAIPFVDWLESNPDATGRIDADPTIVTRGADVISDFSARGPSNNIYRELPGPDLVAAGDRILAPYEGADDAYRSIGGTSMASPHAAGAGALLRALYPGWTPAELQSAMMLTAVPDVLVQEDGSTPATPFDQGSGRLDVAAAADTGLVMDETRTNFERADPDLDDLALYELNVPFLTRHECPSDGCSWTRTVEAVKTGDWTVTASAADFDLAVSPSSFSLTAGDTQTLTITATNPPSGWDWHFGDVVLTEDSGGAADARLPVAITPPPPPPEAGNTLDLNDFEVPGGRVNNRALRLDAPDGYVQGVSWDLTYEANSAGTGAWLDEYRMELESPAGEVMLVGGDAGAYEAPPDEELDHALGWPGSGGTATDARTVHDFDGAESSGIWTLRLYGTFSLQPHGWLRDGASLTVATGEAPVTFSPDGGAFETGKSVDVQLDSANPSSTIVYTRDGSTPTRDNGSTYTRGEVITLDQDTELKAFAFDPDGQLDDAPVRVAGFDFYDPLSVVDDSGESVTGGTLAPGTPTQLTVNGGSGDFRVEAAPNPISGITPRVNLDGRDLEVTVPDTGAFAGRYEITITDATTGWSTTLVFDVDLKVSASNNHVFPGQSVNARVTGATAGYGFEFAITDGDGQATDLASVDPATAQAVDDTPAGNPAETVVTGGELTETRVFSLDVTPEDGTYDSVNLVMSGDEGRRYSGWVQDQSGNLISAEVSTAEAVGPAKTVYRTQAGKDGEFRLQTPLPESGTEHDLSVTRPGYVTSRYPGDDCVGGEPQCTLTLFEATAALSGTVQGLAEGDEVQLYLLTTDPDGNAIELGPHSVTGDGSESDAFRLDANHQSEYSELVGRGYGYVDFSTNDDGRPFSFDSEGEEISDIEIEAVPTAPLVEQLTVTGRDRESATLRVRVHPRERDGNVLLAYGRGEDSLDQTLDPVAVQAGDGWTELEYELAGLQCGTTWHVRVTAENDRERAGQSGVASFETASCNGADDGGSSCSLGSAGSRLDPVLPLLLLLALAGFAGRTRRRGT